MSSKYLIRRVILVAAMVALVSVLSGCGWLFVAILEPYAYVEDETGEPIEGVAVYLYSAETDIGETSLAVADGESNSGGYVGFGGASLELSPGTYYMVPVAPDGTAYQFLDSYEVELTESAQFLGTIVGYLTGELVDGTVINALSGDGIDAATVTLVLDGTTTSYTATTDTDGSFQISNVPTETYTVTATKSGFAFAPSEVTVGTGTNTVQVTGFGTPADDLEISIVAIWGDSTVDVDSYITIPYDATDYYLGKDILNVPNDHIVSGVETGFLPSASGRERISENGTESTITIGTLFGTSDTTPAVEAVANNNQLGPETIRVRAVPIDWFPVADAADPNTYFDTIADAQTNQLDGSSTNERYAWVGTAKYYVHADAGTLMDAEAFEGAGLRVYVMQGSNVKGIYRVPSYTLVNAASLFRINFLVYWDQTVDDYFDYFQIVPEVELYNEWQAGENPTFRSIAAAEAEDVLYLKGRSRSGR